MHCGQSKSGGITSGVPSGTATNPGSVNFLNTQEHADASGLLSNKHPLLSALFSIDLEQEAQLDDHEQRLADIEATLTVGERSHTESDSDQST
jgi:hypothetical protein